MNTASAAPSGVIAPDAVPTRSASRPWYCSDVLPAAGGSDGTRRTATRVAGLWFPTESMATMESRSSIAAAMLTENEPLDVAVATAVAPLAVSVSRTSAPFSTALADAYTSEAPAVIFSQASSALKMPPTPMMGTEPLVWR